MVCRRPRDVDGSLWLVRILWVFKFFLGCCWFCTAFERNYVLLKVKEIVESLNGVKKTQSYVMTKIDHWWRQMVQLCPLKIYRNISNQQYGGAWHLWKQNERSSFEASIVVTIFIEFCHLADPSCCAPNFSLNSCDSDWNLLISRPLLWE